MGIFEIGKTFIEDGASIGANATIICGHLIRRYAMIRPGTLSRKIFHHTLSLTEIPQRSGDMYVRWGTSWKRRMMELIIV